MDMVTLRSKGKYHGRKEIVAGIDGDFYVYKAGNGTKKVSFDYIEWKGRLLSAWAFEHGVKCDLWVEGYRGHLAGLLCVVELVESIEWVCATRGIVCEALMPEWLRDFEGKEVVIEDKRGRQLRGVLQVRGQAVKAYWLVNGGWKGYVKPHEIKNVIMMV